MSKKLYQLPHSHHAKKEQAPAQLEISPPEVKQERSPNEGLEPSLSTDAHPPKSHSQDRFRLDPVNGVYATLEKRGEAGEVWLCSPLEVTALFRSPDCEQWGTVVKFTDPDGDLHERFISMESLHTDFNSVRGGLASEGLKVVVHRGARELLADYIQSRRPKRRIRCVEKVGWHESAYVFADESFQPGNGEEIILHAPHENEFLTNQAGTLEGWRRNVAQACSGNSRLLFSISAAFAPPLLDPLGEEAGGFHFYSQTSTGKTTTQTVAGSVWGGGPTTGFLRSWRTTSNGLESIALLHNDGLLNLDEISQIDPHEARAVAYLLANGHGKLRMAKTLQPQPQSTWRLLFLSSGETTLEQHVAATGRKTLGGQRVRLIDLPADAGSGFGVFENIHGADNAAEFSKVLRQAALTYHGTPIRALVKALVAERDKHQDRAMSLYERFRREQIPSDATGEVFRAAGRFALIAAAGELATFLEITGWTEGEAYFAVVRCFEDWMHARGTAGSSDEEAAVRQVVEFIQRHGSSRFLSGGEEERSRVLINRAGFIQTNQKTRRPEYLILSEVFKREVCCGYDPEFVAKALLKRGMLAVQKGSHLTVTRNLRGGLGKTRVYAVVIPEAEVAPIERDTSDTTGTTEKT
jgi:putative DNA primase/helicase